MVDPFPSQRMVVAPPVFNRVYWALIFVHTNSRGRIYNVMTQRKEGNTWNWEVIWSSGWDVMAGLIPTYSFPPPSSYSDISLLKCHLCSQAKAEKVTGELQAWFRLSSAIRKSVSSIRAAFNIGILQPGFPNTLNPSLRALIILNKSFMSNVHFRVNFHIHFHLKKNIKEQMYSCQNKVI